MIDRTLVQDTIRRQRKMMMTKGHFILSSLVFVPMFWVMLKSLSDNTLLYGGMTQSLMVFFKRTSYEQRELFRPEVYYREKKVKPFVPVYDEWN